jgi:iodotyrosine deiodinase
LWAYFTFGQFGLRAQKQRQKSAVRLFGELLIIVFTLNTRIILVRPNAAMESVGIAAGILITALHHAGLVTLTHTPSPMRFLNRVLDRPPTDRPFLILVTGYPAEGATVPAIRKKSLEDIATFV